MTLATGADILLDDDEFIIDQSVPNHYSHNWFDLNDEKAETPISGMPGKTKAFTDTLIWGYDDWGGGEGNRVYYGDQPDVYDWGSEVNPRIRGQLTGRPNRTRTTLATSDITKRPTMCIGDGGAWVGADDRVHWTTDGTTWTSPSVADTGLNTLDAGYAITAMAGDHEFMYYAAWTSDTSGTRVIMRIKADTTDDVGVILRSEQTSAPPYAGMCVQGGKLYAWTGRKLIEHDDPGQTTAPLSAGEIRVVYDSGTDPITTNVFGTSWWANCFATENSVIAFYTSNAQSQVYQLKKGVGSPFWTAPYGFSIKSACYQDGVCYFFGHWGGDSNAQGFGAAYAIPLDSLRPIHLGYFRKNQGSNRQMQECCMSYGSQVMVAAARTGQIFIYDKDQDSISMLDDLSDATGDSLDFDSGVERIGDMLTFGKYRYAVIFGPGASPGTTTLQLVSYDDDEPPQRETGLSTTNYASLTAWFESPRGDFDHPMDLKTLVGFHLTFKPLVTNQTITVSYAADDAGNLLTTAGWTALTDITSATSGASAGRVFQTVSVAGSNTKFFQLKFRVSLKSASTAATPILYGVFAEAKLARKREEWDISVRMKDELSRQRLSNRQVVGATLRDWLEATVEAGTVVTLRDGFRYREQSFGEAKYTTHNVVIKEATDTISVRGEGTFRLRLVATTEAT